MPVMSQLPALTEVNAARWQEYSRVLDILTRKRSECSAAGDAGGYALCQQLLDEVTVHSAEDFLERQPRTGGTPCAP